MGKCHQYWFSVKGILIHLTEHHNTVWAHLAYLEILLGAGCGVDNYTRTVGEEQTSLVHNLICSFSHSVSISWHKWQTFLPLFSANNVGIVYCFSLYVLCLKFLMFIWPQRCILIGWNIGRQFFTLKCITLYYWLIKTSNLQFVCYLIFMCTTTYFNPTGTF